MSMIACPECSRQVSDRASACPACAYPLAQGGQSRGDVQTIEKTSKALKIQIVRASVLIGASLVGLLIGGEMLGGNNDGFGGLMVFAGLIGAAAGVVWIALIKVKIWWHHE